MYPCPNEWLEEHRLTSGRLASTRAFGNNGVFLIPGPTRHRLLVIASDQEGWEHCSVSVVRQKRTPTWDEMCYVKDHFWPADECVVQYHPPKADYVTFHDFTLHLWRPIGEAMPRPPHTMVGPKSPGEGLSLLQQFWS